MAPLYIYKVQLMLFCENIFNEKISETGNRKILLFFLRRIVLEHVLRRQLISGKLSGSLSEVTSGALCSKS